MIRARLDQQLIAVSPGWRGFGETVRGLVHLSIGAALVAADREEDAVRAVIAREREGSTAMLEIGVGVPHARLPGLRDTVVAFAAARAGLYEPVPTVVVRIVGLVLSPPEATEAHLHTLAGIATLLRSPALREALLAAPDTQAAFAALDRHARSAPA